jgi:N-acetylmuramoyl-L-alanine amidase
MRARARTSTLLAAIALVALLGAGVAGSAPRRPPSAFVVMIDPGHGGSNTGAAGVVEGLYEKRVTLALARAVARRLGQERDVIVKLTREDDRYLTLRDRVRRANRGGADVFVSIHANASPTRGQRGFETYVLTADALEVDARALRAGDGPERRGVAPDTAQLLDDVERGAAQPWAARLAEKIQARLAEARPDSPNRGVKQGSMDVLMGPVMPAVLVEVGFIDHPVEGVELLRRDVREAIAVAIADGILDYRDLR